MAKKKSVKKQPPLAAGKQSKPNLPGYPVHPTTEDIYAMSMNDGEADKG